MPGQYSNYQGGRIVTLSALASNFNILMERGVIYRVTNFANVAGRQGPLLFFPWWIPNLTCNLLLLIGPGNGNVAMSLFQGNGANDAVGNIGVQQTGVSTVGSQNSFPLAGYTFGSLSLVSSGTFTFPLTLGVLIN